MGQDALPDHHVPEPGDERPRRDGGQADAALASLGAVPVAVRRLRPLPAFCAILALYVFQGAMKPTSAAIVAFPAAYVLYRVAVTCRRRASALAAALAVPTTLAFAGRTLGHTAAALGLLLIVAWLFGSMARQRRAYAHGLQQQAASQAVAGERLRIARELHDVVAHSVLRQADDPAGPQASPGAPLRPADGLADLDPRLIARVGQACTWTCGSPAGR